MTDSRTALILIDFQEWIVRDLVGVGGRAAAQTAARYATSARERGDLVVHVRYLHSDGSDGGPNSPESRFLDCMAVLPGDLLVTKYGRSAYDGTKLDSLLRKESIDRVVLAGVTTDGGVEDTAYDAQRLGYKVEVLSNAAASQTPTLHLRALDRLADAGSELTRVLP